MAKTKKHTPALGADYSSKMKSRYSEKVKPSGKKYTKSDRRENRVKGDMQENSKQENIKEIKYQGGCLCGAVRFNIYGPMRQVINCHCGQCLHTHGHFAAYSSAAKKEFHFVNDSGLKWFHSSDKARRGFCQECGASLFYERLGEKNLSIAAGMLDATERLNTIAHIFIDDKPDYYEVDDDLPKFSQYHNNEL